jgi:hypothetical protein
MLTPAGAAYEMAMHASAPSPVPGGLTFAMLSAGDSFNLALTSAGVAYGWG